MRLPRGGCSTPMPMGASVEESGPFDPEETGPVTPITVRKPRQWRAFYVVASEIAPRCGDRCLYRQICRPRTMKSAGSSPESSVSWRRGEADLYPRLRPQRMEWDTARRRRGAARGGRPRDPFRRIMRPLPMGKPGFANGFFIAHGAGRGIAPGMSIHCVIPARYASTRYPGKPLAMAARGHRRAQSLIERRLARRPARSRPSDAIHVAHG